MNDSRHTVPEPRWVAIRRLLDLPMMKLSSRRWLWLGLGSAVLAMGLAGTMVAGMIHARCLRGRPGAGAASDGRRAVGTGPEGPEGPGPAMARPGRGPVPARPLRGGAGETRAGPGCVGGDPGPGQRYARAAESRASVLMNMGRFAPAEACLLGGAERGPGRRSLSPAPRPRPPLAAGGSLRRGEPGAHRRLGRHPDPAELLQDLWQNDTEPAPADALEGLPRRGGSR